MSPHPRRAFLKTSAATGAALVIEFRFLPEAAAADPLAPNAFVRVEQ